MLAMSDAGLLSQDDRNNAQIKAQLKTVSELFCRVGNMTVPLIRKPNI